MNLIRNPNLVAAEMDGELVMMSIEEGIYYGLTGIAPDIWEALETPQSKDQLIDTLLKKYDVPEDILKADVETFLTDMMNNKLLLEG